MTEADIENLEALLIKLEHHLKRRFVMHSSNESFCAMHDRTFAIATYDHDGHRDRAASNPKLRDSIKKLEKVSP